MSPDSQSDGCHDESTVDDVQLLVAASPEQRCEWLPNADRFPFDRICAETGAEVLRKLDSRRIDCLVVTDSLSGLDSLELLEEVNEQYPLLPSILVAEDGSEQFASEAVSAGVTEYVPADRIQDRSDIVDLVTDAIDQTDEFATRTELDGIEAAVEHAADAIVITDPNGAIEYVNPAFESLTGYSKRQAVGRNPRIIKSGEQGEAYYRRMWESILDGEVWEETIVNETRTGEQYIAHQTVAPVTDEDGEIRHFVGIQRDVTRQRRLEEQLERSEATLSKLYDATSRRDLGIEEKIEMVLEVGARNLDFPLGYFTRISDGTQEILTAIGDHDQVTEGATDPLERTYCRKTIAAEDPVVLSDAEKDEDWKQDPAYEHFGLRCYLGAKVPVDGEVYGTLCFAGEEPKEELLLETQQSTIQALANWIGYELEREKRRRKLERQNERLEKFASAVSHDLRNPLNVAEAHAELSLEGDSEEHIKQVKDAHERMETIIEDALTLAREGELVESRESVSLERIARECWQSVETGNATLALAANRSIHADRDKLRHVFENLYRNSVEHGVDSSPDDDSESKESATVTITVGSTDDGFYIEDDGRGIPQSERDRVFEYGYSRGGSSGFGLSIVETIVRAHGWSVRVTESEEGGARFEFDTDNETEAGLVH